jgi:hypothetical protein
MTALDWAETAGQTEARLLLQNWAASESMVLAFALTSYFLCIKNPVRFCQFRYHSQSAGGGNAGGGLGEVAPDKEALKKIDHVDLARSHALTDTHLHLLWVCLHLLLLTAATAHPRHRSSANTEMRWPCGKQTTVKRHGMSRGEWGTTPTRY